MLWATSELHRATDPFRSISRVSKLMKHWRIRGSCSDIVFDKLLLVVRGCCAKFGLKITFLVNPLLLALKIFLSIVFPFISHIGRGISDGWLKIISIYLSLKYLVEGELWHFKEVSVSAKDLLWWSKVNGLAALFLLFFVLSNLTEASLRYIIVCLISIITLWGFSVKPSPLKHFDSF